MVLYLNFLHYNAGCRSRNPWSFLDVPVNVSSGIATAAIIAGTYKRCCMQIVVYFNDDMLKMEN